MATTYRIIRMFFHSDQHDRQVIKRGLTLKEAQRHCRDPETSSRTAKSKEGVALTEKCGPWFDGYEEE